MRKMKDSGVEWIDTIPENWKVVPMKALFSFGKGLPITKDNLTEAGIPVISYGQIHARWNSGVTTHKDLFRFVDAFYLETNAQSLVKKGDFIMADTSEDREGCGNCAYIDTDDVIFAGYHTIILHSLSQSENKYLAYLFLTDSWRSQIRKVVSGVKLFSVSRRILGSCSVIVPDNASEIVKFLDKQCAGVNALISNVQAQIEKLKAYKQSLITEVVTKGLDPNVPMKDSGVEWIGVVPKHWVIIPSKFLFENCDERRRENDVQLTASQKYGMISQKEYMRRENARIVLADKGLENWKHIEPFDFVISLRSFQGGLEMSEVSGCATWHYIVLRAQQKTHPYYYKWLFKSSMYITALQRTCNYIRDGQDLRYSNFVKVPLRIPTLEEQKQIADYLDKKCSEIDELIAVKQTKIEKLEQYKRSLIYEYVTGKKEVS